MSENPKKNNENDFVFLLLLGIGLMAVFPILPITVILTLWIYHKATNGKIYVWISLSLLILIGIFFSNTYFSLANDIAFISQQIIDYARERNFIEIFGVYRNLSFHSWIVIIIASFSISGYIAGKWRDNIILKKVGVVDMNSHISDINSKFDKPIIKNMTEKTLIGTNRSKKEIYCDDKAKHIFVCGTTGSGKTVLLSNFIESGILKKYGMLIIDGKGDVGEGSILEITKMYASKYNEKLYVVSLNDPEISIKYNPFAGASETICKDMLINMTDWSEEHYKRNTERYIQRLLKLLNVQGGILSFKRIIENMSVSKFEEISGTLSKEEIISKDEHLSNIDLIKSSGRIAENASARFSTIAESEIGTIFDESGIDIYTALKQDAIILFILNPLIFPELSPIMGRLILIDAKKAISKMFGSYDERKFFIFDEINVYASTVLIDLINKSRSAGVTCIPATQSLADLEAVAGEPFKQQIIENCNNYVVLRQNSPKGAEEWAKTLGTREKMELTYQINKLKSTDVGTARKTREFIVHPDEIKAFPTGTGVFLSRDFGKCERIIVRKPF